MVIHKYTEEEKAYLREFVPGHSHKEITEEFNRRFSADITVGQIKGSIKRYNLNTGRTGRFEKGHITHNKGKKGVRKETSDKMRAAHKGTHRVYDNQEHTKWHMEK